MGRMGRSQHGSDPTTPIGSDSRILPNTPASPRPPCKRRGRGSAAGSLLGQDSGLPQPLEARPRRQRRVGGQRIRDWIHANSPLGSFFDVHDIPPGLPFDEVLLHQIGTSGAVVAVHTDSYSSRAWCRREVIEAKRRMVPMIVVDCLQDVDPRGMAYLGNVPIIRMEAGRTDRVATIASCLLDDIFRTWLWRCRVAPYRPDSPTVLFTARPPELIALAAVPSGSEDSAPTIVYPEPMLSAGEERLFRAISPDVRMRTLTDWLEERR